ncbi:MFS transporter [Bacillus sp. KH172YL63]|uniref:MFS transporter n=1 Tax=Bacillus sp. KH172YL63 TaxID=2709784 RepID=UPI0013E4FD89|nr:MFS transporter [Bacillus sp. KH172YL63]BCB03479.1 putative MFS-type transporter YitZ [Bacillus sp. KH172YL63]
MKWFIISQSFVSVAAGVSFPFYLLFIQNIGSTYASFGFAYGLFMLSAAMSHRLVGRLADVIGGKLLLFGYSIGMSILFLFIPSIASVQGVYMIQLLLGLLGAVQKTSEKVVLSDVTDQLYRGRSIGSYHFWTSIFSSLAVMGTGFLLDYFTIYFIFYACSLFFFISGILILTKLKLQPIKNSKNGAV